jgi:hypothetical protein
MNSIMNLVFIKEKTMSINDLLNVNGTDGKYVEDIEYLNRFDIDKS